MKDVRRITTGGFSNWQPEYLFEFAYFYSNEPMIAIIMKKLFSSLTLVF